MHGSFSLPIVLKSLLDLFVVPFGFWFHPFFWVFFAQFVFAADRRPPGLISISISVSAVAATKNLVVFLHFSFVDIVPAHIHLRAFYPLFFDNFKGFDSNNFKFTGIS
jgi:hypothetical protein